MKLEDLAIKPEWRTANVVALCMGMREAQDWGAMPILADALQDADCDNEELLTRLRATGNGYALSAGLVGCVMSAASAEAVGELVRFNREHDCPDYERLVNAATGHHDENIDPDQPGYTYSEHDGEYLRFGGDDAHGEIPARLWDLVQAATGKRVPEDDRPTHFSCSC